MADVWVEYEQRDRFLVRIGRHRVVVDQPVGDGGGDAGPSPVELFAASLAACTGFYAERYIRRHDLPVEGLEIECDFSMSDDEPARVATVDLRVVTPAELTPARRAGLRRVVEHCTVQNSLRQPPAVNLRVVARETVAA